MTNVPTPQEVLAAMAAAPPSEKTVRLESAMDRLCQLVTEHGPTHLVRGMPSYQAHEAMLACIEALLRKRVCVGCQDREVSPLCSTCHARRGG